MPRFKTKEEFQKWFETNIVKADDGEFALKPLEDAEAEHAAARRGNDDLNANYKKFKERAQKAESQVKELQGQLESVSAERDGLKELTGGKDAEALQKLNKEITDVKMKNQGLLAELRERDEKVKIIPDLEKKIADFTTQTNRSKIWDAMSATAAKLKIADSVIKTDLRRYVDDFVVDDEGKIFTSDGKSVDNHLVELQKERSHWQPVTENTNVQGGQRTQTTSGLTGNAAVAALIKNAPTTIT